jgi:hypothetical protein
LLVLGALALLFAPGGGAATPDPPAPPDAPAEPQRVSLFGDSLAHEAKSAFALEYQRLATPAHDRAPKIAAYPGTALCDFRRQITTDLLARRPRVVVLEFSGNSGTPCMVDPARSIAFPIGSEEWRERYLDDLRAILAIARTTGTTVVWATAPPVSPARFVANYPSTLADVIGRIARSDTHLAVVESGRAVAGADGAFAATLPCREDERAYCADGQLEVRADDGLHFDCHGRQAPMGECLGYSAGARRFGEAMAAAAVAATGRAA